MWVLILNPMRDRAEASRIVARAETKEQLEAFIERERVEPYKDGQWGKSFRQGGPLEWFNSPSDFFFRAFQDVGTEQDWIENAKRNWEKFIREVPAYA